MNSQVIQAIQCRGKVKHRSAEAAYRHINSQHKAGRIRATNGLKLSVYRCDYCSQWHVGKAKRAA